MANKRAKRQTSRIPVSESTATPNTASGSRLPVFNPDYSYVGKDLRRIGLLAGTFVTVLIVLSFFLN